MEVVIRKIDTNGTHDKAHVWVDGALCAVVMLEAGKFDTFLETIWDGNYDFSGGRDELRIVSNGTVL